MANSIPPINAEFNCDGQVLTSLGLAGCLNKVGDELNPEQAVFVLPEVLLRPGWALEEVRTSACRQHYCTHFYRLSR